MVISLRLVHCVNLCLDGNFTCVENIYVYIEYLVGSVHVGIALLSLLHGYENQTTTIFLVSGAALTSLTLFCFILPNCYLEYPKNPFPQASICI